MDLRLQHFLVCLDGRQLRRVDDSVPLTNSAATDKQLDQRSSTKTPCMPSPSRLSLVIGKETISTTPLNRYVHSLRPAAKPGRAART
jgi:hypothetical protein